MAVNLVERLRRAQGHGRTAHRHVSQRHRRVAWRCDNAQRVTDEREARSMSETRRSRRRRGDQRGAAEALSNRAVPFSDAFKAFIAQGWAPYPTDAARAAAGDRLDRGPPRGAQRAVPRRAARHRRGRARGPLQRHRLPLPAALGVRPPDRVSAPTASRTPSWCWSRRTRRPAAATTRPSTSSRARRATPRSSTPTPATARCGSAAGPRWTRWAR